MRRMWRPAGLAGAGLLVLSVSACDPYRNFQGPVAVRVVGGEVQLAVCTDVEVGLVYVLFHGADDASAEWEAVGLASFRSGEVITAESLREMYEHPRIEQPPDAIESVEVLLQRPNERNNVTVILPIEGAPTSPDDWLQSDGRWTTQKCP